MKPVLRSQQKPTSTAATTRADRGHCCAYDAVDVAACGLCPVVRLAEGYEQVAEHLGPQDARIVYLPDDAAVLAAESAPPPCARVAGAYRRRAAHHRRRWGDLPHGLGPFRQAALRE